MLMVSGKDEEGVSVGVCEIYRYALIEERLERNRLIEKLSVMEASCTRDYRLF